MKNITYIIILILFTNCSNEPKKDIIETITSENSIQLTQAQIENAEIKTGVLEQKKIPHVIRVSGKIDVPPQNLVSVSVPLGGYLKFTQLLPGMHVRKGEVIATLEDQQYIQLQQDYLTTKIKLEMSEAEYNRQKDLNASKANSDKVLQQSKMEYLSLKIAQQAYAEKLELININPESLSETTLSKEIKLHAPFDGFVAKINVNVGKYISPNDVMFELVNPSDIHLNLHVFEKDLTQISVGQKVIAFTNSNPDKKHVCEIILISQNIDSDGSSEIHCHFEKYDKNLLPGMYMNAEVDIDNIETYALPENSVVTYGGKNYLFIQQKGGQFDMTEVSTGNLQNGWIEIKNAETLLGKTIVTSGAYTILMSFKNRSEE